jgi:hypothetical protein
MNIDQILATIAALQEAGTDEAVIKKMILAMLAEEAGVAVELPAGDAPAMASEPPADQGAAPITSQPMAARNPAPSRPQPQRPGAQPQRVAQSQRVAQPQRPAAPAQPAAAYSNQQSKLQVIAGLIGHAFKVRDEGAPLASPLAATRPASYANQPAPQPQRAAAQPQPAAVAYADDAPSTEEQLLENTLFNANERLGRHTGQNATFLRKLLRQDPALYAEAISDAEPLTYQEGGASPAAVVGARPLANTGGPMAERNAMANKAFAYRDAEIKAGRPCTYDQALTKILQQRGPAPQR